MTDEARSKLPTEFFALNEAPRMFHRVMDATLLNVRRTLEDVRLRFAGRADPDVMDRMELVLAEVLNNITLHGVGGLPAAGALTAEGRAADSWPRSNIEARRAAPRQSGPGGKPGSDGGSAPVVDPDDCLVIHLTVTQHAGGLACAVVDNGTPLPESCLVFPDTFPSPEVCAIRAGGFGWYIIRDLTRSLFYFREGSRNVLCFNIPRRDLRPSGHSAMGAA